LGVWNEETSTPDRRSDRSRTERIRYCRHQEQAENGTEFIEIMSSNDRLKVEIHGPADFITEIDLPELKAEFTPEVLRLYKVNMLCNMFFWVGWNSRGAIEEAEQLKRMVEYT
jgi:hypothetical protein